MTPLTTDQRIKLLQAEFIIAVNELREQVWNRRCSLDSKECPKVSLLLNMTKVEWERKAQS